MTQTLTDEACKKIIKMLARMLQLDAKDIATKFLDEDGKNDLRTGAMSIDVLELHLKIWKKAGCPDYVNLWKTG